MDWRRKRYGKRVGKAGDGKGKGRSVEKEEGMGVLFVNGMMPSDDR
jgi:hypothetical protein